MTKDLNFTVLPHEKLESHEHAYLVHIVKDPRRDLNDDLKFLRSDDLKDNFRLLIYYCH